MTTLEYIANLVPSPLNGVFATISSAAMHNSHIPFVQAKTTTNNVTPIIFIAYTAMRIQTQNKHLSHANTTDSTKRQGRSWNAFLSSVLSIWSILSTVIFIAYTSASCGLKCIHYMKCLLSAQHQTCMVQMWLLILILQEYKNTYCLIISQKNFWHSWDTGRASGL